MPAGDSGYGVFFAKDCENDFFLLATCNLLFFMMVSPGDFIQLLNQDKMSH